MTKYLKTFLGLIQKVLMHENLSLDIEQQQKIKQQRKTIYHYIIAFLYEF